MGGTQKERGALFSAGSAGVTSGGVLRQVARSLNAFLLYFQNIKNNKISMSSVLNLFYKKVCKVLVYPSPLCSLSFTLLSPLPFSWEKP